MNSAAGQHLVGLSVEQVSRKSILGKGGAASIGSDLFQKVREVVAAHLERREQRYKIWGFNARNGAEFSPPLNACVHFLRLVFAFKNIIQIFRQLHIPQMDSVATGHLTRFFTTVVVTITGLAVK